MEFTPEERAVVAQCIAEDPSLKRMLTVYWPYILPLCAGALYGVLEEDYVIIGIAFFFLICEVLWFLHETAKSSNHLKSALIKYESSESSDNAR